jgi:OOP family OmpA-OmpF porin
MSRWARSGAVVVALAAVAGAATVAGDPAGAQGTDLGSEVRDLTMEVRGLRFEVVSLDNSVTDVVTPEQEQVTLAADVFFAFDKDSLTIPAAAALSDLAPRIAQRAKGTVTIDGYTDAQGAAAYNVDLSKRRAMAVQAELERRLSGRTLAFVSVGHGATDYIAPNTNPDGSDNPTGRARNRRVTITYQK